MSRFLQVSQRFYNSHALLNMAVYLPATNDNVIAGVRVAVGHFDTTDMGDCACLGSGHADAGRQVPALLADMRAICETKFC